MRAQKGIASFLSVVSFLANGVFCHALETNLWAERQRVGSRMAASAPLLDLAALPRFPALSPHNSSSLLSSVLQMLPANVGTVRKILPSATPSKRVVLHIQDVHLNSEAQQNIAVALQSLLERNGINLIGLEGAFQSLDFSWYRAHPDAASVAAVADYLLRKQFIGGPMFTALRLPVRVVLPPVVGVDDQHHYSANVQAVQDAAALKPGLKQQAHQQHERLEAAKATTFNAELKKFDAVVVGYHTGSVRWEDYSRLLLSRAEKLSPALQAYRDAFALQQKIDFARMENERARVVSQLLSKLSRANIDALTQRSAAYRAGSASHADFYAYLKNLCRENSVDLAQFPTMDMYIRYVTLADRLDVDQILRDMRALEFSEYAELTKNNDEVRLVARSRHLLLIDKLLDFALTNEEWQDYKALASHSSGLMPDADLAAFENFYREAERRDERMAENFLRAAHDIKSSDASVSVLVTGGFHSVGIDARLSKAGCTVISYAPKISKIEGGSGSEYLSVFTQEKTPLDRLFAGEKLFLSKLVTLPAEVQSMVNLNGRARQERTSDAEMTLPDGDGVLYEQRTGEKIESFKIRPTLRARFLRALGKTAVRPRATMRFKHIEIALRDSNTDSQLEAVVTPDFMGYAVNSLPFDPRVRNIRLVRQVASSWVQPLATAVSTVAIARMVRNNPLLLWWFGWAPASDLEIRALAAHRFAPVIEPFRSLVFFLFVLTLFYESTATIIEQARIVNPAIHAGLVATSSLLSMWVASVVSGHAFRLQHRAGVLAYVFSSHDPVFMAANTLTPSHWKRVSDYLDKIEKQFHRHFYRASGLLMIVGQFSWPVLQNWAMDPLGIVNYCWVCVSLLLLTFIAVFYLGYGAWWAVASHRYHNDMAKKNGGFLATSSDEDDVSMSALTGVEADKKMHLETWPGEIADMAAVGEIMEAPRSEPGLEPGEEIQMFRALHAENLTEWQRQDLYLFLVKCNEALIHHIMKEEQIPFTIQGYEKGQEALIRAITTYDPRLIFPDTNRPYRFVTWAYRQVLHGIYDGAGNKNGFKLTQFAGKMFSRYAAFVRKHPKMRNNLGGVANALGIDPNVLRGVVYMYRPIHTPDALYSVAARDSYPLDDTVEIGAELARLSHKQQFILKASFGMGTVDAKRYTLVELGAVYGVSKTAIANYRDAALRDLELSAESETPVFRDHLDVYLFEKTRVVPEHPLFYLLVQLGRATLEKRLAALGDTLAYEHPEILLLPAEQLAKRRAHYLAGMPIRMDGFDVLVRITPEGLQANPFLLMIEPVDFFTARAVSAHLQRKYAHGRVWNTEHLGLTPTLAASLVKRVNLKPSAPQWNALSPRQRATFDFLRAGGFSTTPGLAHLPKRSPTLLVESTLKKMILRTDGYQLLAQDIACDPALVTDAFLSELLEPHRVILGRAYGINTPMEDVDITDAEYVAAITAARHLALGLQRLSEKTDVDATRFLNEGLRFVVSEFNWRAVTLSLGFADGTLKSARQIHSVLGRMDPHTIRTRIGTSLETFRQNKTGLELLALDSGVPVEWMTRDHIARLPLRSQIVLRVHYNLDKHASDGSSEMQALLPLLQKYGFDTVPSKAQWNTAKREALKDLTQMWERYQMGIGLSWQSLAHAIGIRPELLTSERLATLTREDMSMLDAVHGLFGMSLKTSAAVSKFLPKHGIGIRGDGQKMTPLDVAQWEQRLYHWLRTYTDGWDLLSKELHLDVAAVKRNFWFLSPLQATVILLTYGIGTRRAKNNDEKRSLLNSLFNVVVSKADIEMLHQSALELLSSPAHLLSGPKLSVWQGVVGHVLSQIKRFHPESFSVEDSSETIFESERIAIALTVMRRADAQHRRFVDALQSRKEQQALQWYLDFLQYEKPSETFYRNHRIASHALALLKEQRTVLGDIHAREGSGLVVDEIFGQRRPALTEQVKARASPTLGWQLVTTLSLWWGGRVSESHEQGNLEHVVNINVHVVRTQADLAALLRGIATRGTSDVFFPQVWVVSKNANRVLRQDARAAATRHMKRLPVSIVMEGEHGFRQKKDGTYDLRELFVVAALRNKVPVFQDLSDLRVVIPANVRVNVVTAEAVPYTADDALARAVWFQLLGKHVVWVPLNTILETVRLVARMA